MSQLEALTTRFRALLESAPVTTFRRDADGHRIPDDAPRCKGQTLGVSMKLPPIPEDLKGDGLAKLAFQEALREHIDATSKRVSNLNWATGGNELRLVDIHTRAPKRQSSEVSDDEMS